MTANVRRLVLVSLALAGAFAFAPTAAARVACATTAVLASDEYVSGITLVSGCGPFPPGPQWTITTVPSTGTTTLNACPVAQPDPVGFVITRLQVPNTGGSCNGLLMKQIRRPTASTTQTTNACAGSVIPVGFVIASVGSDSNCPQTSGASSGPWNAIRLPVSSGDFVCSTSTLPAGYVINRYDTNTVCSQSGQPAAPRKRILVPPATSNTTVCAGSPVPPNFAYFSSSPTTPNCSTTGSGSGPGMVIGPPVDDSIVCSGTIPAEFSVVQITTNDTNCANGLGLVVRHPVPSGSTECVLAGRPVPAGYVITRIRTSPSECNGGPDRDIRTPPTNGSTLNICNGTPPVTDFVINNITNDTVTCPTLGSPASLRILKPSTTQSTSGVCVGWPFPTGLAISSLANIPSCAVSGSGPSVTLSPITSGSTICAPPSSGLGIVPTGYVITRISSVTQCEANGSSRAFEVTAVPTNATACTVSNVVPTVPSGYVITDFVGSVSACGDPPAGFGTGYHVSVPDPTPGVQTTACAVSPVPTGFVIVETRTDFGQCSAIGNSNGKRITVPSPTGTTTTCIDASVPVPTGMVITEILTPSSCGGQNARVIQYPSVTGDTQVCAGTTIPAGYSQIGGSTNFDLCAPGAGTTGPGFVIRPNNPAIIPSPGVTGEPDVTSTPAPVSPICPSATPSTGLVVTGTPKNTASCP